MKPAPFAYERAESVEHVLGLLGEHGDQASVLAGGQSLVPMMNMRQVRPALVVDITRIGGLGAIEPDDGELRVGALVTQFALERHDGLEPAVAECLPYTGHYVTRHRGTVGGSVAHGEPRAELPLLLLTLGGSARVRSVRGARDVPAEELYVGAYQTSLAADELLVHTSWPVAVPGEGRAFAELAQRHGDYTLACAACHLRIADGRILAARVGVGATADRPLLVPEAARELEGSSVGEAAARAAGAAAEAAIEGYDDLHASAAYRRRLAGVLVARAARQAMERARG
ncbi:MAG TPA: FAD binding domain-containing protein [Solirubrobacteraceae bacterium]|nr:FAD binding domain-containing protein [Solirubrobacteraceae bacterium]